MCGTPQRSRTTRTGPAKPGTSRVPDTSATRGGAGGAARPHAAAAATAHASASVTLRGMAIKDGLLADYDHEMGTTRKLLERLPHDKLSWKPHAKTVDVGGPPHPSH